MENLVLVSRTHEGHVLLFTLLIEEAEKVVTNVGGLAKLYCKSGVKVRVMLVTYWIVVLVRLTVMVLRGGEYWGVWMAVDELDG